MDRRIATAVLALPEAVAELLWRGALSPIRRATVRQLATAFAFAVAVPPCPGQRG